MIDYCTVVNPSSSFRKTLSKYINLHAILPFLKVINWTNVFLVELEPQHLLLYHLSEDKLYVGGVLGPVLDTFLDLLGDPWSIFILFHNHVNPETTQLNWEKVLWTSGSKAMFTGLKRSCS